MHELDGILESDDVVAAGFVDQVDDRGQGGGLARAGRPGDQDQAGLDVGQAPDLRRQPELVDGHGRAGNDPKHGRGPAPLAEQVDPEACKTRHLVGEVGVAGGLELLPAFGRRNRLQHVLEVRL